MNILIKFINYLWRFLPSLRARDLHKKAAEKKAITLIAWNVDESHFPIFGKPSLRRERLNYQNILRSNLNNKCFYYYPIEFLLINFYCDLQFFSVARDIFLILETNEKKRKDLSNEKR